MITFIVSFIALILGYVIYGKFVAGVFQPDNRQAGLATSNQRIAARSPGATPTTFVRADADCCMTQFLNRSFAADTARFFPCSVLSLFFNETRDWM